VNFFFAFFLGKIGQNIEKFELEKKQVNKQEKEAKEESIRKVDTRPSFERTPTTSVALTITTTDKSKKKFKNKLNLLLIKYLTQLTLCLDHVNLMKNILLIYTGSVRGLNYIDGSVILVDLLSLGYFQYKLMSLYLKHKGKPTASITSIKEREMVLAAFPMQNGKKITLPMFFMMNYLEIARLLIFLVFKEYLVVFGIVFGIFNIWTVIYLIRLYLRGREYYASIIFPIFILSMLIESVFFLQISSYAVLNDTLRNNYVFNFALSVSLVSWIFCSLIASLTILFCSDHKQLYKNFGAPIVIKSAFFPVKTLEGKNKVKNRIGTVTIKNSKTRTKVKKIKVRGRLASNHYSDLDTTPSVRKLLTKNSPI
jgi:hypothetical protein